MKFDGYFEYLCDTVMVGENGRPYTRLVSWLHRQEFVVKINGDANRAYEGQSQRSRYKDIPESGCTVFEMLVALSKRMVFLADGIVPFHENTESEWFITMIRNLGLYSLDDEYWNEYPREARDVAEDAIVEWMNREYDYDGTGGLFPLKHPKEDQTKVEIWYQMNAYLTEKMEES